MQDMWRKSGGHFRDRPARGGGGPRDSLHQRVRSRLRTLVTTRLDFTLSNLSSSIAKAQVALMIFWIIGISPCAVNRENCAVDANPDCSAILRIATTSREDETIIGTAVWPFW